LGATKGRSERNLMTRSFRNATLSVAVSWAGPSAQAIYIGAVAELFGYPAAVRVLPGISGVIRAGTRPGSGSDRDASDQ
jgi:hypothetical protein